MFAESPRSPQLSADSAHSAARARASPTAPGRRTMQRPQRRGRRLRSRKSLIVFWTDGGMSQQDTYDLKPDAPAEYRGHVSADRARDVPGVVARRTVPAAGARDGPAVDRPVGPSRERHPRPLGPLDADRLLRPDAGPQRPAEAVVRLGHRARPRRATPTCRPMSRSRSRKPSAIRGPSTWARRTTRSKSGPTPTPTTSGAEPGPARGLAARQPCDDRAALLKKFDTLRRDIDETGVMEGLDTFKAQALEMVTGDRVREAFDLIAEDSAAARPLRPAPLRPERPARAAAGRSRDPLRDRQHRLLGPSRRHRERTSNSTCRRSTRRSPRSSKTSTSAACSTTSSSTAPASSAARR